MLLLAEEDLAELGEDDLTGCTGWAAGRVTVLWLCTAPSDWLVLLMAEEDAEEDRLCAFCWLAVELLAADGVVTPSDSDSTPKRPPAEEPEPF